MSEPDSEILTFIAGRLVNVYHEDENTDFVLRLKRMATEAKEREDRKALGQVVNLQYFREGGKWYSDGSYRTFHTNLWQIWDEVQMMLDRRELPGLMKGHDAYCITVDVPQHPNRHPHLIYPMTMPSKPQTSVSAQMMQEVEDVDSSGTDRERRAL